MYKVEYKITGRYTKDCINEILEVERMKGLTPENLVEQAKDEDNPLHDFFEWEDSIAADKYRLQQARMIINDIKVIVDNKEYFAFESIKPIVNKDGTLLLNEGESEGRIYKPIVEILNNENLRQQIIRSALKHLEYWESQNAKYKELEPIILSARKVREKLDKQWQQQNKKKKPKK